MNSRTQEFAIAGALGGIIAMTAYHLVDHLFLTPKKGQSKGCCGITTGESQSKVTTLSSSRIPVPLGPFSAGKAVKCGETTSYIWTAGQLGTKPDSGMLVSDDVSDQARQALTNLQSLLDDNQSSLKNVVKVTVYLTSMDDFAAFNEVYKTFFIDDYPARTCIAVHQLPLNARVEVEATVINQ